MRRLTILRWSLRFTNHGRTAAGCLEQSSAAALLCGTARIVPRNAVRKLPSTRVRSSSRAAPPFTNLEMRRLWTR